MIDFAEEMRHAAPTIAIGLLAWVSKRIAQRFTSTFERLDALEEAQIRAQYHASSEARLQSAAHEAFEARLAGIERKLETLTEHMMGELDRGDD